MVFQLCLLTNGSEAGSRFVDPGPQWAVGPKDEYFFVYIRQIY